MSQAADRYLKLEKILVHRITLKALSDSEKAGILLDMDRIWPNLTDSEQQEAIQRARDLPFPELLREKAAC